MVGNVTSIRFPMRRRSHSVSTVYSNAEAMRQVQQLSAGKAICCCADGGMTHDLSAKGSPSRASTARQHSQQKPSETPGNGPELRPASVHGCGNSREACLQASEELVCILVLPQIQRRAVIVSECVPEAPGYAPAMVANRQLSKHFLQVADQVSSFFCRAQPQQMLSAFATGVQTCCHSLTS